VTEHRQIYALLDAPALCSGRVRDLIRYMRQFRPNIKAAEVGLSPIPSRSYPRPSRPVACPRPPAPPVSPVSPVSQVITLFLRFRRDHVLEVDDIYPKPSAASSSSSSSSSSSLAAALAEVEVYRDCLANPMNAQVPPHTLLSRLHALPEP